MWFHIDEVPRGVEFTEAKSRAWLPGVLGGREESEELLFSGYRISVWEDEKSSGDVCVCTAM